MKAELIHFVESPGFTDRIDKLASLDVLFSLQNDLVKDPELGDLMAGCAGARKGPGREQSSGQRQKRRFLGHLCFHRDRGDGISYPFFRLERKRQPLESRKERTRK